MLLETPYFMTLSFPVSILFATLMSMGRLAKDNELMAMFTNGIILYRLFLPFLLLSLASVGLVLLHQRVFADQRLGRQAADLRRQSR